MEFLFESIAVSFSPIAWELIHVVKRVISLFASSVVAEVCVGAFKVEQRAFALMLFVSFSQQQ